MQVDVVPDHIGAAGLASWDWRRADHPDRTSQRLSDSTMAAH